MCIWLFIFTFASLCIAIASFKRLSDLRESVLRMQKHQNVSKLTHPEEVTQQKDLMRNMESMLQQILNVIVYEQKHPEVKPKKKKPSAK